MQEFHFERFEGKKTLIMGEASTGRTKLTASLLRKATVFPFQHVINAIVGIMLSPLYAVVVAFDRGTLHVAVGTGTFFAYSGEMPGGLGTVCDLLLVQQCTRLNHRVRCLQKFEEASSL